MTGISKSACFFAVLVGYACGRDNAPSTASSSQTHTSQIKSVESYSPNASDLLTQFNNDAVKYGLVIDATRLSTVQINFSDGPITDAGPGTQEAIGVCEWYQNKITIRLPEAWPYEYPSQDRFYRVFAHEAGHCLLNLLHNDSDATIEFDGTQVTVPGRSRIMASRESELNSQFKPEAWPLLKTVFYNYAKDVASNKVDGIADAEGLALSHSHDVVCAWTY